MFIVITTLLFQNQCRLYCSASADICFLLLFFVARIVQGIAAVDFRLPETTRPVRLAGLGDEIFNRRFSGSRGRLPTASSKYTVNIKHTVNSRFADIPAITDKIQIPGESYKGLTGNDSRYYGLSLIRNYGHFWWSQKNNVIVLTLDKADTMKLSYDIIT